MKSTAVKTLVMVIVAGIALSAGQSATSASPHVVPDEASMQASLTDGADWLLTATQSNGQLSALMGSPPGEEELGGRLSEAGLALLSAYQATGVQAYMDRAQACADLVVRSVDAGAQYVVARTGVLPTEAGGGFPNVQTGKVDDAWQAGHTGIVRFSLWESLRGIMFMEAMYRETDQSSYLNTAVLLDRLIPAEFYWAEPDQGLVSHVDLSATGDFSQGNIASTTEHGFLLYVIADAEGDIPNLWDDLYDIFEYIDRQSVGDGSFHDRRDLPGQLSDNETKHAIMVPALLDIGRPQDARPLSAWVLDQQQADGHFDCPHDMDDYGDTAVAALALLPTGEVTAGGEALSWLISEQAADGSWPFVSGHPPEASKLLSSAWAVLALHKGLTNYNLQLVGDHLSAEAVWEGDPAQVMAFTITATVVNQGLVAVEDATVRVYDGPKEGKLLLAETSIDVPARGSETVDLEFRPTERGPHEVHVWVEYGPGGEYKERDNNASIAVNLNREPTGAIAMPTEGQLFPFGASIEFNASDLMDLDGDPITLTWSDNVTGFLSSRVTFTRVLPPGDHEVELFFDDGNGPSTRDNVTFSVRYNVPPTIRISTPAEGARYFDYQTITFNASASSDAEDHDLTFSWDSDLAGYLGYGPAIKRRLSHGLHTVTVWVDDSWANVSKQVSIRVIETFPPDVVITLPVAGREYVTTTRVAFDGNDTTDQDSDILEYFWYSNIDGQLSERPKFLTKLSVGHHRITLAVNDGNYNISTMIEIDVLDNRPPNIEISWPPNEETFLSTDLIELNGSKSLDMEDQVTYFWVSDRDAFLGDEPVLLLHLSRGNHRITLWVDDDHGHNVSTSINVVVQNVGPTAGISAPVAGTVFLTGTAVQFMSATSTDPDDSKLDFEWFIRPEDGDWVAMGTTGKTTRSFKEPGTYEVRLIVSDGKGATDQTTVSFQVKRAPKADDGSPGFGAAAALSGALVAAVLVATSRRRRR